MTTDLISESAPPANSTALLDRYQHTIEELDAWSHENDRVADLNAAVTAARATLDAHLAALEKIAQAARALVASKASGSFYLGVSPDRMSELETALSALPSPEPKGR